MSSRIFRSVRISRQNWRFCASWIAGAVLASASLLAWAKEAPLTAIEIYDGPSGAAYVQLNAVLINGKVELRECAPCASAPIDKSIYNKLPKMIPGPGGTLERGRDGVLRYSDASGVTRIVVPTNAKFEKRPLSASELADQSNLKGSAIAPGTAVPPLSPGVTLVFVAAPDVELAEYLRAKRANNIEGWQAYLGSYAKSPHSGIAHVSLGELFSAAGKDKLASYQKSGEINYDDLKAAHDFADQARKESATLKSLAALDQDIAAAQARIVEQGRKELDLYRDAVKTHSPGYVHLGAAQKYVTATQTIAVTADGEVLQNDVVKDQNTIQNALRQAESSAAAKQFEVAIAGIAPYRMFADEEPRIAKVIDGAYAYHLEKGRSAAGLANWPDAISELTKAVAAKDTSESRDLLANAREQLVIVQDKDAAAKALDDSKGFEQAKDILKAYEVLDELPLAQRRLVADDIERLKPAYVQRSSDFAKDMRKAHDPIRGVSDEAGIEKAYIYLNRAYKLSQVDSYLDRMNLLGDDLSAYRLEQSKHYLTKPAGSGTELGWKYLSEALPYKASNMDAVRDAMMAATAAHAIRSKLSIRVQFRDQTSQRDSAGFAGQLENALITGLEGLKIPVKVVRAGEVTPVEPDYQLEGDVLQHHLTTVPVMEAMESKYLASTREVQSDDWNKANRVYEKAKLDLDTLNSELQGAQAKGNKHKVEDYNRQIVQVKNEVEQAHAVLDSTPKMVLADVVRPYSYTKKTVTLTASIQMQFRINDSFSSDRGEMVPINKQDQKQYVELENVKPEDTEGVKAVGTIVDPVEFVTGVDAVALNALLAEVRKRVEALPHEMYKQARQHEDGSDNDGAGELYLRYLEIVPADEHSTEQQHAREFLAEQFNMHPAQAADAR